MSLAYWFVCVEAWSITDFAKMSMGTKCSSLLSYPFLLNNNPVDRFPRRIWLEWGKKISCTCLPITAPCVTNTHIYFFRSIDPSWRVCHMSDQITPTLLPYFVSHLLILEFARHHVRDTSYRSTRSPANCRSNCTRYCHDNSRGGWLGLVGVGQTNSCPSQTWLWSGHVVYRHEIPARGSWRAECLSQSGVAFDFVEWTGTVCTYSSAKWDRIHSLGCLGDPHADRLGIVSFIRINHRSKGEWFEFVWLAFVRL